MVSVGCALRTCPLTGGDPVGDKSWKRHERVIADKIGGQRRGPDVRGERGGKNDIIHDLWSPECKLLSRPSFSDILNACKQAEANAEPLQMPVAFVKKKNASYSDTIVAMRLDAWLEWFVSKGEEDEDSVSDGSDRGSTGA